MDQSPLEKLKPLRTKPYFTVSEAERLPLVLSENAIDSSTPQLPLLQLKGGCRPIIIEGASSVEIQWFTGESYEKNEKYIVDRVGYLCKRCF